MTAGELGAALVAIEARPGRALLRHRFTGAGAARVADARARLAALHRAVAGGAEGAGQARRDLVVVTATMDALERSWTAVAIAVLAGEREIDALERDAVADGIDLGVLAAAPLRSPLALRDALSAIRSAALADPAAGPGATAHGRHGIPPDGAPRSLDRAGLAAVRAQVSALRRRYESAVALRARPAARRFLAEAAIAAAERSRAELVEIERRVGRVVRRADGEPGAGADVTALRRRVDGATTALSEGRWAGALVAIEDVESAVRTELARIAARRAAALALARRYDEIVGRFRAYRAKAAGRPVRGPGDAVVEARVREVRRLLAQRPCDLDAAAWALLALQDALTSTASAPAGGPAR